MNSPRFSETVFSTLFILLLLSVPSVAAQEEPAQAADKHLGTWKLVSIKYGNASEFRKSSESHQRLKLITKTHFTWVEVHQASKQVRSSAGGVYTLMGNSYTETIDFVGPGMEAYLGKAQKFTIRVEGDKFYLSGELSDGLKIEEIWERAE